MYKVLLVDDEKLVLKSLAGGVDWEKSGFYVSGTASNGIDALEQIEKVRPNVVFTDIRMPGISGLELIKKAKEIDKDIQFIVISGYAEFAYVQKSINYGVLGYCLKPFDEYEIEILLKKALENLSYIKEKRNNDILKMLEDTKDINSQQSFERLLYNEGIQEDFNIVVSIGKSQLKLQTNICLNIGSTRYVYFISADKLHTSIKDIKECEGVCGVGITKSTVLIHDVIKAIEDATTLAWGYFIRGNFDIFYPKDPSENIKATLIIKELEAAVCKNDALGVLKILNELQTAKNYLSITHVLKIYNTVYFHIILDSKYNATADDYVYSKEQLYHLFNNFDSMISYLKEFLNNRETSNTYSVSDTKNANLKEIIKYINENYSSDISVQSISKDFFLNPNYLSQLFKRELNITFTEFLTKVRLNHAKDLLGNSNLSIGEIAESIGYRDYFYFIKLFKKNTSQTPGQYRNKELGSKG